MMMQTAHINYRSSSIHFLRAGTGPQPILCFHGYGEDVSSFSFLSRHLSLNHYTIIAIDLPLHGQTNWQEGNDFSTTDVFEIIQLLLTQLRKEITLSPQITLVGFSLGARVALSLYQRIPAQIHRLVLLAPDGLKVNAWYWLATQTWLGNKFFAFTMKRPGWFIWLLRLMNRLKLVNASVFKFVKHYIDDPSIRQLLYARWTTLRKLKPSIPLIKSLIQQHATATRLVYGKHDRIILPSVGKKFCQGIEGHCKLNVIAAGHQVLLEKNSTEIISAITQ